MKYVQRTYTLCEMGARNEECCFGLALECSRREKKGKQRERERERIENNWSYAPNLSPPPHSARQAGRAFRTRPFFFSSCNFGLNIASHLAP